MRSEGWISSQTEGNVEFYLSFVQNQSKVTYRSAAQVALWFIQVTAAVIHSTHWWEKKYKTCFSVAWVTCQAELIRHPVYICSLVHFVSVRMQFKFTEVHVKKATLKTSKLYIIFFFWDTFIQNTVSFYITVQHH